MLPAEPLAEGAQVGDVKPGVPVIGGAARLGDEAVDVADVEVGVQVAAGERAETRIANHVAAGDRAAGAADEWG